MRVLLTLPKIMIVVLICERCNNFHNGSYGSGRFCNTKCVRGFATVTKRQEINERVKEKLSKDYFFICKFCQKEQTSKRKTKQFCNVVCSNKGKENKKVNPELISKWIKDSFINGREVTGGTTDWVVYKEIKVQGSYELRACHILDGWKESCQIFDWEYTNDRIQYVGIDDKNHTYLLDFKVWITDKSFYYIETKGYIKEVDELKWAATRNQGFALEIWMLEDIEKYERD